MVSTQRAMTSTKRTHDRGIALLELSIVLPLILLLFAVLVELANWISIHHQLNNVAYEAARYATEVPALVNNDSQVLTRISQLLAKMSMGNSNTTVEVERISGTSEEVEIRLSLSYKPWTPFGSYLGPVSTSIRSPYLYG